MIPKSSSLTLAAAFFILWHYPLCTTHYAFFIMHYISVCIYREKVVPLWRFWHTEIHYLGTKTMEYLVKIRYNSFYLNVAYRNNRFL